MKRSDSEDSGDLRAAIDQLCATFAPYADRGSPAFCDHCVSAEEAERLASTPLRALGPDDLHGFAFKAITTWGDVEDFKQLLPRILELLICDPDWQVDCEIVLGKLSLAEWSTWPKHERAALDRVLKTVWRHALANPPGDPEVESWLCGLALIFDDLAPFLADWERVMNAHSHLHLAMLITANAQTLVDADSLSNPWLESRSRQEAQIVSWLARNAVRRRLERAFFSTDDEESAATLSQAVEIFDLWKRARANRRQ